MLCPVEDIGFCRLGIARLDQRFFHQILHLLHRGDLPAGDGSDHPAGQLVNGARGQHLFPGGHMGFANGLPDLSGVKGHHITAALADGNRARPGGRAFFHRDPLWDRHKKTSFIPEAAGQRWAAPWY